MFIYSAQNGLNPFVAIAIRQGQIVVTLFNNAKALIIYDNCSVDDYQWHWVEILRSEGRMYVIIDSKLIGVQAITGFDNTTVHEFHLGSTATISFQGKIRNILINGHFVNLQSYMTNHGKQIFMIRIYSLPLIH